MSEAYYYASDNERKKSTATNYLRTLEKEALEGATETLYLKASTARPKCEELTIPQSCPLPPARQRLGVR